METGPFLCNMVGGGSLEERELFSKQSPEPQTEDTVASQPYRESEAEKEEAQSPPLLTF